MRPDYREEPCKSALNPVRGMRFRWSLNPYMGCAHRCTFCYVRAFERRADRPSDDRYGRQIRIKTNVAEVLASELRRPSWSGELVVVGAATDPYQPAEARYRLTRACLEVFSAKQNPVGIITRAPLIQRDLDVLQDIASQARVTVSFSVPTLDEDIWRQTEPGTPHPRQRLKAMAALVRGGVRAGVAMSPLIPGLSDDTKAIDEVIRAAKDHGAAFLWGSFLHLRKGTREHFLAELRRSFPDIAEDVAHRYDNGDYLPESETAEPLARVSERANRSGIDERHLSLIQPHRRIIQTQIKLSA